jgi:hypothetical protein
MTKHHPEQRSDEIFLGNVEKPRKKEEIKGELDTDEKFGKWLAQTFCPDMTENSIGWKTQRLGEFAYDINGRTLKFSVPCFIKRSEVEAALKEETAKGDRFGRVEVYKRMLEEGC